MRPRFIALRERNPELQSYLLVYHIIFSSGTTPASTQRRMNLVRNQRRYRVPSAPSSRISEIIFDETHDKDEFLFEDDRRTDSEGAITADDALTKEEAVVAFGDFQKEKKKILDGIQWDHSIAEELQQLPEAEEDLRWELCRVEATDIGDGEAENNYPSGDKLSDEFDMFEVKIEEGDSDTDVNPVAVAENAIVTMDLEG